MDQVQSNLNSSTYDGLFTMANSNSILSPYEILPIAQENKYLEKLSLWVHSTYHYCIEDRKDFPKLSPFASWPGAMINPHWLELSMSWTNFHGPKEVRGIEVWL